MANLYRALGGADGLRSAVAVFATRLTEDADLAPYFAGVDLERLKAHQQSFLTAALGGPDLFAGRPIEQAHGGLGITPEHFERLVDHLAETLSDLGADRVYVAAVRERIEALRPRVVGR